MNTLKEAFPSVLESESQGIRLLVYGSSVLQDLLGVVDVGRKHLQLDPTESVGMNTQQVFVAGEAFDTRRLESGPGQQKFGLVVEGRDRYQGLRKSSEITEEVSHGMNITWMLGKAVHWQPSTL